MSRIGRLPVTVPAGVDIAIEGQAVTVKGPKGQLGLVVAEPIAVAKGDSGAIESRSLHGLTRTLIANMVQGVTAGYEKKMEIVGTGYRVQAKGENLEFALGYSHPITVEPPSGITFVVEAPTRFSVQGIDKQQVGEVAANIRKLRKPDPYKAKGIRYAGEQIRLGTCSLRSSTTPRARPSRVPRRWKATCALSTETRPPRPRRSASCSPSGPRQPVSRPSSSTVAATSTTAGSRRSPTVRAREGSHCEHRDPERTD